MNNQNSQNYGGIFGSIVPFQNMVGGKILAFFIGASAWDRRIGWLRRSIFNLSIFLMGAVSNILLKNETIALVFLGIFILGIITSIISSIIATENTDNANSETVALEFGGLFGFIAKLQDKIGGIILQIFIGKPAWEKEITWLRRTLFNVMPIIIIFFTNLFLKDDQIENLLFSMAVIILVVGVMTSIIKLIIDELKPQR